MKRQRCFVCEGARCVEKSGDVARRKPSNKPSILIQTPGSKDPLFEHRYQLRSKGFRGFSPHPRSERQRSASVLQICHTVFIFFLRL